MGITIPAMPQAFKRALISLGTICGGVYFVLSVYLYARQTDFIFIPSREIVFTPKDSGCDYTDLRVPVPGSHAGRSLHAWWLPAPANSVATFRGRTLLYAHGNAGNVGTNAEHACRLNRMGFAVLIFDYRGYGQSNAPPDGINEKSIYADGEAAWQYLVTTKPTAPQSIILYGHSLGAAVAIELAKRHPDAGSLIVESAFTSLRDIADSDPVFRLFPLALILDQKMANEDKLRAVRVPMLMIHGTADRMVPTAMAQKLHAAAAGPKQLFLVANAGHDDVAVTAGDEYAQRIVDFLQTTSPAPLPAGTPAPGVKAAPATKSTPVTAK